MKLFDQIGLDIGYVIIGLVAALLIFFILLIIALVKLSKIKNKYKEFLSGADGKSLESLILERFSDLEKINGELDMIKEQIRKIDETLLITYQKIGIVKYDAFKEMGGKLSFSLALLNEENNGFILNSMHSSREGCYTYIKEVIKGETFVKLAEEEKKALEEALNYKILQ